MRRPSACLVLILLLAPAATVLQAESLVADRILELQADVLSYQISPGPVISGSEQVYADSLLLARNQDYLIDYQLGVLKLLRFPESPNLRVQYIQVPPALAVPLYRYEVLAPSDSLFRSLAPRSRNWLAGDGKLLISGAKTFAITFSDEDAFDLKQSLYVNLDGELSQNVNISAQLSDSQSKLTPEGDSKELSSLDRVFVRVYGKQYEIAMGDLNWKFEGTRYINYQTSIEGLNAWYRGRHFAQAGFTASSGKPASVAIPIVEGKQGPYYLNPTGWQSSYLLIAGSEQIFRDGTLLERGTDYYIDYSEGSVMFRTLVVPTNLVNAYFQYADEYYRQSTYFNSSRIQILPGLSLSHHLIHQADSKTNPLLFEFTQSDLDSLALAGDALAWGSGVQEVDSGLGSYVRRMTPEGIVYYEYAENDTTASYNLTFSYVGSGAGDYEEYSSGKYRYVGSGLGAWLPRKRLVPAVRRSNADLGLRYESGQLELGVEGIYTANDRNTFSRLEDNDNASGLLHAYGQGKTGDPGRESYLRLDFERRWADSFLFTQAVDQLSEYDFALLDQADSLAKWQIDLTLGTRAWTAWNPELMARYSEITGLYTQKALRFVSRSPGQGWLPSLNLRTALSAQDYETTGIPGSLLQYLDLDTGWDMNWLKAKLLLNYSSLAYDEALPGFLGNRYYKFNPQISLGDPKVSFSQFSFAQDASDIQNPGWSRLSTSRTYALKHSTATLNHTLNVDFTHREVDKLADEPKNNYDLINLRNSNYFLKQAIMLMGNYQLNQTEFFPKIQELEYIGDGLGLYDSTGVYTPDGDYDYTYITSDQGTLSTEINTQLSLYLKPGNVFPAWKKVHSDIIVQATEQSADLEGWSSYLFWPGTVYNSRTIFGKQSYSQTLWLDIVTNKVLGNLNLQFDRSLDNRYQSLSRTSQRLGGAELDFKQFWGNNYNLKYELSNETDTRYLSDISLQTLGLLIQRNLSSSSIITLDLNGIDERGSRQGGTEDYILRGVALKPGYRGSWGSKGRISGSFGLRYNERSGSDFLTFLPEKREGLLFSWALSAIYRLNSFSSATFEYSGSSNPEEDVKHSLKLEFKAEL